MNLREDRMGVARGSTRLRPTRYNPPRVVILVVFILSMAAIACSGRGEGRPELAVSAPPGGCEPTRPVRLGVDIHRRIPRDPGSYTQGLVIHDGVLYESSGLYGRSALMVLDPQDWSVRHRIPLPERYFGEGIAFADDARLIQLTWKAGIAHVWHIPGDGSEPVLSGEFVYDTEGWGLATLGDGTIVLSDGSDRLAEHDLETFEVLDVHVVTRTDGPADMLNELEFDGTWLWANRYQTDEIVRIDPRCWMVTGVVDVGPLRAEANAAAEDSGLEIDVANGIAFDPGTGRYLLTGKLWPLGFEVELVDG